MSNVYIRVYTHTSSCMCRVRMRVQERVSFGGDTPQSRTRLAYVRKGQIDPMPVHEVLNSARTRAHAKTSCPAWLGALRLRTDIYAPSKQKGLSFQLPRWFPTYVVAPVLISACDASLGRSIQRTSKRLRGYRSCVYEQCDLVTRAH